MRSYNNRIKFCFTGSSAPNEKVAAAESLCGRGFVTIIGEDAEYMSMINLDQDTAIEFTKSILKIVGKIQGFEIIEPTKITMA